MSDDPMEYIRNERRFAKFFTGADPTPNELATQFLKLGPQERATALNDLGKKIDNPDLSMSVERAGKLHAYRRALISAHNAARRVNR